MINYFTLPLEDHKYAQARVLINEDSIYLQSYNTIVIKARRLTYNTYEVECTGTYSMTTIRHIGWFMKEYFPNYNYYTMKAIAGTNETIILTKGNK